MSSAFTALLGGAKGYLPAAFGWTPDVAVSLTGPVEHNYNPVARKPAITGNTYWVDPVNGLDTNNGLTSGTPFATLFKGVSTANVQSISLTHNVKVKGGIYRTATQGWFNLTVTRSLVIESWDGNRILNVASASAVAPVYTKTVAQTNVYQMALAAAPSNGWVFDFANTVNGFASYQTQYAVLTLVADIATCDATAGSYFYDLAGTTLYVHTIDSRAADANVQPLVNLIGAGIGYTAGPAIFWCENIDFIGGGVSWSNTSRDGLNARSYLNSCTAQGTTSSDGFSHTFGSVSVGGIDYYYRCGAFWTKEDGFTQFGTTATANDGPYRLEIECVSRNNGNDGTTANNGTTQHANCKSFDINCTFAHSQNRLCQDIWTSRRVSVGCSFGPSDAAPGSTSRTIYAGQSAGQSTMIWLDRCTIVPGSQYDLTATSGSSILFKGSIPGGVTTDPANTGTIGTY